MPRRPKPASSSQRGRKAGSAAAGGRAGARIALWRSVARSLEKDIISGRLAAGSRLATETALSRQFGVNRHTLRRAIAELAQKGLVRTVPQAGSFVAPLRIPFLLGAGTRISQAIEQTGGRASGRLKSARICTPPREVAEQLGVAHRTPVIELVIVRLANDVPFAFVTAWLPADRFAGIDKLFELTGSLQLAIAKSGVPNGRRKSMRIMGRAADDEESTELGIDRAAALLILDVVVVDPAGEPIAVLLTRFPALRTEFVIES